MQQVIGQPTVDQEFFDEIQDVKVTKDMLDLAKRIVNQKSGRFEP
jgi:DNA end-binding protein Ku